MRHVLLTVSFALLAAAAAADEPAEPSSLELSDDPLDILGGRLKLRFPASAQQSMRPHDIMSAAHSNRSEDRVVVDLGEARFVMMAYEKFARAGGDLPAAAARLARVRGEQTGATYESAGSVDGPGGVKAVSYAPDEVDPGGRAINIYIAMVACGDDTLQELAFFINPKGVPDRARWVALAGRIVASVAPGERTLETGAGVRELDEGVSITVPEGIVTYTQPGPDFLVHHAVELAEYGDPPVRMGIYWGNHPSMHIRDAGVTEEQVEEVVGTVFGTKAKWFRWHTPSDDPAESAHHQETLVFNKEQWALHVFMYGPSVESLERTQRIAESATSTAGPFVHAAFMDEVHAEADARTSTGWEVAGTLAVLGVVIAVVFVVIRRRRRSS